MAISVKMVPKVLLEDCIMPFFPLYFHTWGKKLQKSIGLMCFFLAVETDVKYYQQAAKSHKAITFQDLSQGGTAPGGISPYVVTVCRFYATFIMLVQ